jgi:hypothetical protein
MPFLKESITIRGRYTFGGLHQPIEIVIWQSQNISRAAAASFGRDSG